MEVWRHATLKFFIEMEPKYSILRSATRYCLQLESKRVCKYPPPPLPQTNVTAISYQGQWVPLESSTLKSEMNILGWIGQPRVFCTILGSVRSLAPYHSKELAL